MTQHHCGLYRRQVLLVLGIVGCVPIVFAEDSPDASVEQERLETMRSHILEIRFRAQVSGFPEKLTEQPIFRYDDLTRGYVDGTVWRLGATGRPKAIITTELHPKYSGSPRIVCDYLSLSETPFVANVTAGAAWTPAESAVKMNVLPDGPKLVANKSQRLFQLKKMAERFAAHQTVEGQELELRLLPRPIDRYRPIDSDENDAAMFLFVSGRNPGILLVIEVTDSEWQYGIGRLSGPSALSVTLDGKSVWQVSPANYQWNSSYTAANFPIFIPGSDR